MKNKWMKSKVMNNFGLKVISLVVAFIVWLVIINTTNPTITKTFTDIPVKVINENVITSLNQVYEVVDGDMVDVVVKGKRSFVEELTNDDFSATADLSKLSTVNTAGIQVKLNKATKENVELDWNNEVLRISLEEKESQQVRVQIDTEGELAESYVLGDITAQPNIIEISGGKSKIKKVDSIGAVVQLKGQNSNFSADVTPILYDSEGEVIDSSNVTFSNDTIHVEVEVVPTKTIPLYVEATGTPASGYRHVQTDYKPDSIVISGKKSDLENVKSIKVSVSVEGAKADVEQEIDLTQYLYNTGCKLTEENTTVSIRCVIEKNGKRTFSFVNSDINVKNLPNNLNFTYVNENKRNSVTVQGGEDDLSKLTLTTLGAYIDVKGLAAGQHTVEVQFDLPENLKLKSKVRVEVLLTQSEDNAEKPTEEPTATPAE